LQLYGIRVRVEQTEIESGEYCVFMFGLLEKREKSRIASKGKEAALALLRAQVFLSQQIPSLQTAKQCSDLSSSLAQLENYTLTLQWKYPELDSSIFKDVHSQLFQMKRSFICKVRDVLSSEVKQETEELSSSSSRNLELPDFLAKARALYVFQFQGERKFFPHIQEAFRDLSKRKILFENQELSSMMSRLAPDTSWQALFLARLTLNHPLEVEKTPWGVQFLRADFSVSAMVLLRWLVLLKTSKEGLERIEQNLARIQLQTLLEELEYCHENHLEPLLHLHQSKNVKLREFSLKVCERSGSQKSTEALVDLSRDVEGHISTKAREILIRKNPGLLEFYGLDLKEENREFQENREMLSSIRRELEEKDDDLPNLEFQESLELLRMANQRKGSSRSRKKIVSLAHARRELLKAG